MITINTLKDLNNSKNKIEPKLFNLVNKAFKDYFEAFGDIIGTENLKTFDASEIGPIYVLEDLDYENLENNFKNLGIDELDSYEDENKKGKYSQLFYVMNNEYGIQIFLDNTKISKKDKEKLNFEESIIIEPYEKFFC